MKKLYVTLRHNHNLTQLGLGGHYSRLRNARTQDPTIFFGSRFATLVRLCLWITILLGFSKHRLK